ncbi:MAG: tail fiber domain-containing protein [Planctomycetota bacterium]|jgi:hypothetical protein
MKSSKMLTILVLALGLVVCTANVSEAAPMGTAFTYQSRLIDANAPAEGLYDFQLKLYDNPADGNQFGSTIDINDLDVIEGFFTVYLDFGPDIFTGSARWLETTVAQSDGSDPCTLTPRVELTPTPYAIYAQEAADLALPYSGTASSSDTAFSMTNTGTGAGIHGVSDSTLSSVAGVIGEITSTSPGGFSTGVRGINRGTGGFGIGVWGSQDGGGWGVNGTSSTGIGVYGQALASSGTNYGVCGSTSSSTGYAGYFVGGRNYFGGNVGIGTLDPDSYRLKIKQAVSDSGFGLQLENADASKSIQAWVGTSGAVIDAEGTTDLHFRTDGVNRMFIANSGDVGIGTTSPDETLHVAGDFLVAGGTSSAISLGAMSGSNRSAWFTVFPDFLFIVAESKYDLNDKWLFTVNKNGNVGINAPAAITTLEVYANPGTDAAAFMNGNVGIGTETPQSELHVVGNLRVSSLLYGDRRNVQWDDTTGLFYYDNSSKRYKENIKPLEDNFAALLEAEPKTYTRPGDTNRCEIGYIAEEFHDLGLTKLVDYDAEGHPDGINYGKICLYLTEIVKKQQTQIEALEAEAIKELKVENESLKDRIEALERIIQQHQFPVAKEVQ